MRKLTSILAGVGLMLVCCASFALPIWQKTFNDLYKPKSDSAIAKAKCALCHVRPNGGGGLNPYGKMLRGKKIGVATLKSIEENDADNDGASNIAEIKAGALPGDAKSKPANRE